MYFNILRKSILLKIFFLFVMFLKFTVYLLMFFFFNMGELCFLKKYIFDFALGINEKSSYAFQKFPLFNNLRSSKFIGKFY